jgi:hypothetical protein
MHLRGAHPLLIAAIIAIAALIGSASAHADVPASGDFSPAIWSDKADYSPGEHVVLIGTNWQAGETVHITVNDSAGSTWDRSVDVTADATGNVTDEFTLPDWFIATYHVRAEGASGSVATYDFTDGNVKFDVAPSGGTAQFVETLYTAATNCTGAIKTPQYPKTISNSAGDNVGVGSSESLRIDAAATSDQGGSFSAWSSTDVPGSSFTVISGTGGKSICVTGFSGSGTHNYRATYNAPPANAAPTVAADNATRTVNEGQTATNTGTYSDANAGDSVAISASVGSVTKTGTNSGTWSWSFATTDGPVQSQTVTITADDGHGGVTTTTFALTVNNVAPTATLSAPDVDEGQSIAVSLTSPQDVAADLPGLQYAFDCGSGYGAFGNSNSTSCPTTADGTKTVKAKIRDKDNGETEYTRVVTIRNAAPVAGTVAITPSSATAPTTNSTLTATPSGFSDPGGDSLTYHYVWKNGSTVVGGDSDTLDLSQAGNGAKGDTITVSVTASDGTASSSAATDSVTVKNSGPSAGTVAISPSSATAPTTNSTLTATPSGFGDDDGDSLTYHYVWKNGTTVVGTDSATLDLSALGNGNKGDTIHVSVTASDGSATSSAATDSVTVKNTPPSTGTVAITPSSPTTNSTLTAAPSGFGDDDGDSLTYHYVWKNGSTVVGTDSDTLDLSQAGNGNKGDTIHVSVTASDGTASSSAATDNVTVANTAPTAGTVAISPSSATKPTTDDTLTATPSGFSDDDSDSLAYHYVWKNGTTTVGTDSNTLDLSQAGNGAKGDTIHVTVTASDGTDSSGPASDSATVKNSPPSAGTVAITPSSSTEPTTNDTLTATPSGFSDDDGDSLTYHYTWKNGTTTVGTDSATLDLSALGNGDKGDTIHVSVTASDGTASGGAATDSVNVKNTPPTAGTVAISPSSSTAPTTNSTLTATPSGFSDDDGESLSYHYTWKNGTTTVGTDSATLDLSALGNGNKGDTIHVSVTATDGDDSSTAATDSVTVKNTAPTVGTVAITPSSSTEPTTNDTLTATPSGFSDDDGDSLTYHYVWKNGTTTVGTDSAHLDLSQAGNGAKGDTIHVNVTASDGDATSTAATDSVTVKNTPPSASTVAITPSSATKPITNDTLTATPSGFSDDDGDSLTYHYVWKNGATTVGTDSNTLDLSQAGNGDKGDTIHVTVTASDGTDSSGPASDSATVKNAAPTANAGGGASGYSGQEGVAVQLNGSSADADGDTRTYDWSYSGPATCSFDDHTSADPKITCADDGSFTVSLTVTDTDGASSAAATAALAVGNVAPTATWNRPGSAVNEGDSFTLSLTDPQDVAADLPGLEYRFDCGTGTYSAYSSTHSKTCATTDDGTLHVAAQVRDKDNGVRTYTDDVTVKNVAPTVTSFTGTDSLTGPLTFVQSTFTTSLTDPGADSWFANFSYSDGTPLTQRMPTSGLGFASGDTVTHTFATAGCNQTATVRVTDDDGGVSDAKTATVSVGTGSFLAPLANQPVSDKLKNGQVLPVKVRIADCNGIPVMNLLPTIKLVKGDLTSVADDAGEVITISSVSSADTGTTMRPVDGSYIYNLRVSVAASDLGKDFTIIIYPYGSTASGATLRHVIIPTK